MHTLIVIADIALGVAAIAARLRRMANVGSTTFSGQTSAQLNARSAAMQRGYTRTVRPISRKAAREVVDCVFDNRRVG